MYHKILKSDGIVGLCHCMHGNCWVFCSCYLGFFDTLKPILLGENPSITASHILGYTVALSIGLISYPLDTKQVYGDDHEVDQIMGLCCVHLEE